MNLFVQRVAGSLDKLSKFLMTFGPAGLIAVAFLDSVMVPMPGGVDAVLLLLSTARPAWMLIYAAAATFGSTAGCLVLYRISRRAGQRALARFSVAKRRRVKQLLERYDVLSVLVASVLPPPFPFKLFVVSAGVFRLQEVRFAIAIGAGRAFRYLVESYLAARYGEHARILIARHYPAIGAALAGLIIVVVAARAWLRQVKPTEPQALSDVES